MGSWSGRQVPGFWHPKDSAWAGRVSLFDFNTSIFLLLGTLPEFLDCKLFGKTMLVAYKKFGYGKPLGTWFPKVCPGWESQGYGQWHYLNSYLSSLLDFLGFIILRNLNIFNSGSTYLAADVRALVVRGDIGECSGLPTRLSTLPQMFTEH